MIGWPELLALLTSIGYGVLSALVPLINAEAYVVASQVTAVAGAVPVAVGVAIGQTGGKAAMFYAVRRGRELPSVRRKREARLARPAGPRTLRWRAFVARLLELVGDPRWGLPITFVAAFVGIPPLYAVALLAGATTMSGVLRFVLVALGVDWAVQWWA
jgi:hypothetical protein